MSQPKFEAVPLNRCWCGSTSFAPFNEDYRTCLACGTLLCLRQPASLDGDKEALYGERYWVDYQTDQLSQPTVMARARTDLSERCLYWLRALLRYKQPPARILEIGSAHGGFVALLREAGFDAHGVELSSWIINLARQLFGIDLIQGPIDQTQFEAGSFDAIVLLDVLEHLADPVKSVEDYAKLLKPDGILFIQTPQWNNRKTYDEMRKSEDALLLQLMPLEHLYLFTPQSVTSFLGKAGFSEIAFEPALFSIYDMFFVASRRPLTSSGDDRMGAALEKPGGPLLVRALLDLYEREEKYGLERKGLYADREIWAAELVDLRARVASDVTAAQSRDELEARHTLMQVMGNQAKLIANLQTEITALRSVQAKEHPDLVRLLKSVIRRTGLGRGLHYLARGDQTLDSQMAKPQPVVAHLSPVSKSLRLDPGLTITAPLTVGLVGGLAEGLACGGAGIAHVSAAGGPTPPGSTLSRPAEGSFFAALCAEPGYLDRFKTIMVDPEESWSSMQLLKGRLRPGHALLFPAAALAIPDVSSFGLPSVVTVRHAYFKTLPETWIDPLDEEGKLTPAARATQAWPKISVVLVSFNQARFLEEGILSVLDQGYPNLELIVIDAQSSDGSAGILERYRDKFSALVIEPDKGQSDGLNKGFARASGDILTWLNSDDLLEPGALVRVAQAFGNYKTDMVIGGCRQIGETRAEIIRNHHSRLPIGIEGDLPLGLLLDFDRYWQSAAFFYQPEVFFSRDLWQRSGGTLRTDLHYVLDYDLWIRMAAAGARYVHIPDYLACSRTHKDQKTKYGEMPYLPEVRGLLRQYHKVLSSPILAV